MEHAPSPGDSSDALARRIALERQATATFAAWLLAMAIVCGAVIISGYFAGVIEDHAERVFWAGAVLSGVALAVFAAAAFPGGTDDRREASRIRWTLRVGLLLALVSPALCVGALVADFYG